MTTILKLGNLFNAYSNHSGGIEAQHIMRASGHKNEGSIRSYSCRLSEAKKREMSDCLGEVLGSGDNQKENESLDALENITLEELDAIFNDNNTFSEVHIPQNQPNLLAPPQLQQSLSVLNLNSLSTSVSTSGINVYPALNNCIVHFNFAPPK
jgi:hypothetical protein